MAIQPATDTSVLDLASKLHNISNKTMAEHDDRMYKSNSKSTLFNTRENKSNVKLQVLCKELIRKISCTHDIIVALRLRPVVLKYA